MITPVQDENDLVGEFTAARKNKLLIFADECFLAGNVKDSNVLKNLITGKDERDRAMFKDPNYRESFAQICCTSNFEHFLPATEKARRFLCVTSFLEALFQHPYYKTKYPSTDPTHTDYIEALIASLAEDNCKGFRTLMNLLFNLPINKFDPRKIPVTFLLAKQKVASLPLIKKWWLDCLIKGWNDKGMDDEGRMGGSWETDLKRDDLYEDYKTFAKNTEKKGYSKDCNTLGLWTQDFVKLIPKEVIGGVTIPTLNTEQRIYKKLGRKSETMEIDLVHFPDLETCRNYFESIVPGAKFFWEKQDLQTDQMKDRVRKLSERDLFRWAPKDFYGYNLQEAIRKNTLKIVGDDEWEPADDGGMEMIASLGRDMTKAVIADAKASFDKYNAAESDDEEPEDNNHNEENPNMTYFE